MKKYISVIIILLVATFLFGACSRSASKTIVPTPTLNVPEPTQGSVIVAEDLNAKATEAAAAEEAAAEGEEATTEDGVEVIEDEPTAVPATATPEPELEVPDTVRPESYTLVQGEWPICIARRFDLDISAFFALNGLSMDSRPSVGTVLKIPADGNWSANYGERAYHSHPANYVVKAGDTLNTIACYYGDVSPEQIAAKNGLETPYVITAGQELQIP
jgi:LysM repeat protein